MDGCDERNDRVLHACEVVQQDRKLLKVAMMGWGQIHHYNHYSHDNKNEYSVRKINIYNDNNVYNGEHPCSSLLWVLFRKLPMSDLVKLLRIIIFVNQPNISLSNSTCF